MTGNTDGYYCMIKLSCPFPVYAFGDTLIISDINTLLI